MRYDVKIKRYNVVVHKQGISIRGQTEGIWIIWNWPFLKSLVVPPVRNFSPAWFGS